MRISDWSSDVCSSDLAGEVLGDSLSEDEGLLYQDIDLADCVEPKQFHDVVGYYNRFDIFRFSVDSTPRPPVTFVGEPPVRSYPFGEDEAQHDASVQRLGSDIRKRTVNRPWRQTWRRQRPP